MQSALQPLVSEAEYLQLPETTQTTELVDGELILAPNPSFWHQEVLGRLMTALRTWVATGTRQVTVAQAPLDVRFGPGRILQPDGMVFLTPLAPNVEMPIARVPELCIEVLSSNRAYDRLTKRYLYAEAGVTEYWLVDPRGWVERRTGPGLSIESEVRDRLATPLLPDFELDVPELLAPRP